MNYYLRVPCKDSYTYLDDVITGYLKVEHHVLLATAVLGTILVSTRRAR